MEERFLFLRTASDVITGSHFRTLKIDSYLLPHCLRVKEGIPWGGSIIIYNKCWVMSSPQLTFLPNRRFGSKYIKQCLES